MKARWKVNDGLNSTPTIETDIDITTKETEGKTDKEVADLIKNKVVNKLPKMGDKIIIDYGNN